VPVQVYVNAEAILAEMNCSRHGNRAQVTGWTLIDFICLPPKATIYLSFGAQADENTKAFLNIRRLS